MTDASSDVYIGLVILLSMAGLVVTPWLAVRGVVLLARRGDKRTRRTSIKGAAVMAWACAVGVYAWGVLHLLFLDESSQALACRERLKAEQATYVDGYEYSFIPLRFRCRVTTGQTYEAVVPGYVNPATGIFAVTAAALTFAARSHNQHEETNK